LPKLDKIVGQIESYYMSLVIYCICCWNRCFLLLCGRSTNWRISSL